MKQIVVLSDYKVEYIPIKKVTGRLLDFRNEKNIGKDLNSLEFQQFKDSIEKQGLFTPVILTTDPDPSTKNAYLIVDGLRRIEACRQLHHKEVKAIIINDKTPLELMILAGAQNIHRINLDEEEKTDYFIKVFASQDFATDKIKEYCSKLNYTSYGERIGRSMEQKTREAVPTEFKKIVELLGYSPTYIYQLVKHKTGLSSQVYKKCIELNVPSDLRTHLTKSPLSDPRCSDIQLQALSEAHEQSKQDQRLIVNYYVDQAKKWLESGQETAITRYKAEKDEGTGTEQPEIVKHQVELYFGLKKAAIKFLFEATGYKEKRGPTFYKPENVQFTEDHRQRIVEYMDENKAYSLRRELIVMQEAVQSLLDLIEAKYPPDLARL